MNESDKNRFQAIMLESGEVYGKTITPILLGVYFRSFANYSIEQVAYAFGRHLGDPVKGDYFPRPSEIHKILEEKPQSTEDKAALAWQSIIGKIHRVGLYGSLHLDDHMALAALESIGGWEKLCMTNEDKLTWKEREFIQAYQLYERTPLELLPKSLPGRIEIENAKAKNDKKLVSVIDKLKQLPKGDK